MAAGRIDDNRVCRAGAFDLAWAKGHSLLNAVFQFAGIFFGVFLGMFAFGETLDWLSLIGVGVIFSAGLFSSIYLKKH